MALLGAAWSAHRMVSLLEPSTAEMSDPLMVILKVARKSADEMVAMMVERMVDMMVIHWAV